MKTTQKKSLLRSLIDKVVIHRVAPDRVHTRVIWRGGATTTAVVPVPIGSFASLSNAKELEQTIEQMSREGHSDQAIAKHLTTKGHRSPRADRVLCSTVREVRLRKGILRRTDQSHPHRVPGFLTIPQLAEKLGVSRWWIHDRIRHGTINAEKDPKGKCYLFPDTPEMLAEMNAILLQFQLKSACRGGIKMSDRSTSLLPSP
jgi:hypothetical protein